MDRICINILCSERTGTWAILRSQMFRVGVSALVMTLVLRTYYWSSPPLMLQYGLSSIHVKNKTVIFTEKKLTERTISFIFRRSTFHSMENLLNFEFLGIFSFPFALVPNFMIGLESIHFRAIFPFYFLLSPYFVAHFEVSTFWFQNLDSNWIFVFILHPKSPITFPFRTPSPFRFVCGEIFPTSVEDCLKNDFSPLWLFFDHLIYLSLLHYDASETRWKFYFGHYIV